MSNTRVDPALTAISVSYGYGSPDWALERIRHGRQVDRLHVVKRQKKQRS